MFKEFLKLSPRSRKIMYWFIVPSVVLLIACTVRVFMDYNAVKNGIPGQTSEWPIPCAIASILLTYIPLAILTIKEKCFNRPQFFMILVLIAIIVYTCYFYIP